MVTVDREWMEFDEHCPHCHGSGKAGHMVCGCWTAVRARRALAEIDRQDRRRCWMALGVVLLFPVVCFLLAYFLVR